MFQMQVFVVGFSWFWVCLFVLGLCVLCGVCVCVVRACACVCVWGGGGGEG